MVGWLKSLFRRAPAAIEPGDFVLVAFRDCEAWVAVSGVGAFTIDGFIRSEPVPAGYRHGDFVTFVEPMACRVVKSALVDDLIMRDFMRRHIAEDPEYTAAWAEGA